jgi:hypothetical protein
MISGGARPFAVAVLLSLSLPFTASAQAVATSFEELRSLVKPGETIHLTDATGRTIRGRVGDLSASSLEVLVRQTAPDGRETFVPQRRLSESDVRQILVQRRDPVWKGTLIGAAVVGGPWLLVCNPATDWCYYGDGENLFRGLALITTAIGAGIGALIDVAINERTMVYYRSGNQRSGSVQIAPVVSTSAAGIQMSVRF